MLKKIFKEIKRFIIRPFIIIGQFLHLTINCLKRSCYFIPFLTKFLTPKGFYKHLTEYKQAKFVEIYPKSKLSIQKPKTLSTNIHEKFNYTKMSVSNEYITQLENTRIIGKDGILVLSDDMGVLKLNLHADKSEDLKRFFREKTYIKGTGFYLCST